jgi:hypothetical protein
MQRLAGYSDVNSETALQGTILFLRVRLWWRDRCVPHSRSWVIIGCILLGIVSTLQFQLALNRQQSKHSSWDDKLRYLPTAEFLKAASLGYSQAGADLLWLQIIQKMGGDPVEAEDRVWLRDALDVVTTLDPHFVEAYDLGSVMLAELIGQVGWSNALLEKGMAANPEAWRLPFVKGFNDFFHFNEYARAANSIAEAARLPGAPSYLAELATRLFAQARKPEAALVFIDLMLEETENPSLRGALEYRRKEIVIERDIIRIEEALTKYRQRYNGSPLSLVVLVQSKIVPSLPVEPFGGTYQLDHELRRVVSSTHGQRLRLHRPAQIPMLVR